ncbi:MAG: hypothetical protein IJO32_03555 [Bacilli bacterium]|nr:hypothetical protein [Bacilli bacterium]
MKKKVILRISLGISLILTGILSSMAMNTSAAGDFEGKGTEKDPYIIKTAEQLQNVGKYCGKDNAKYFKMEVKNNKLDMKDIQNFKPICSLINSTNEEKVFKEAFYGHFDGNNTELINFKIETDAFFGGLFGATNGATIKNIGIGENSSITVKEKLFNQGTSPTGGIVGYARNTTIENVWNSAKIEGKGRQVGGIVGKLQGYSIVDGKTEGTSTLKKAKNSGEVSAERLIGGIVGYVSDNVTIENIENKASVTGVEDMVGGIVGCASNKVQIKDVTNTGVVNAGKEVEGNSDAGGIVGYARNTTIENVENKASVTGAGASVGGIVGELLGFPYGYTIGESSLIKATNSGKVVAGKNYHGSGLAGGIVGVAFNNSLIEDVLNTASVTGDDARVGGIVGELSEYSTLRNALNYNENITGSEHVGLLIGIMPNDSITTATNTYTLKENTTLNGVGGYHNEYSKITSMKGFTKEEMKNKENFVGFDFENIWVMGSEHPELKREITIEGGETISGTGNTSITIKYNTKTINVSNYLYKKRTYVDLYTFCSESGICEVHKDKENEKIYKILKSESLTNTDDQKKYHYLVEHKAGTFNFKSTILIGGRSVVDDINTQLSTDVISCPDEVTDSKYQCSGNTIYVPVRFLTQALGLRVEWDGDTNTVIIKNNFEKTFNDVYTPIITEGKCEGDISSCTLIEKNSEGNYELEKDKTYYLGTMKKNDKTVMKFKRFFSFYESVDSGLGVKVDKTKGEPYTYTRFTFSIRGPEIKIGGPREQREDVAQIIMYEIATGDDVHDAGSYPMLINGSFIVK